MRVYCNKIHYKVTVAAHSTNLVKKYNGAYGTLYKIIEQKYGITERVLKSRLRTQNVADLRAIAMQLIYDLYKGKTKVQIGLEFKRDHSTVIHAMEKFNALYNTEVRFRETYDDIKSTFLRMTA